MTYATDVGTLRADFRVTLKTGASDESRRVDESLDKIRNRILAAVSARSRVEPVYKQVAAVVCDHTEPGWDGYSASPVSEEAGAHAVLFVLSLPPGVPSPEISADPSGGIELEWYRSSHHVFTACLTRGGKIYYAGLLGRPKRAVPNTSPERSLGKSYRGSIAHFADCWAMIAAHEEIVRYVFEESYYRKDGSAKAKAFYPDKSGRCSVFVTSGLSHQEIVDLGYEHVAPERKPLLGHIPRTAADVRSAELDVELVPPPDRHAEIFGYPDDRDQMMLRALELAKTARFIAIPAG
jgi:hypothetical protein